MISKTKSFRAKSLIGHRQAESLLRKLYDSQNLGQAWIFSGPKGIGKIALAYRLICFLYSDCGEKNTVENQGLILKKNDKIFAKLDNGAIRDFLEIAPLQDEAKKRKQQIVAISSIRKVIDFYSSYTVQKSGKKRVCLIDDADSMTVAAANALLKILEEPPFDAIFILIAHSVTKMPITIRSRCRNLPLRPLSDDEMKSCLHEMMQKNQPNNIEKFIKRANGIPAKAIFIHQQKELYDKLDVILNEMPELDIDKVKTIADKIDDSSEQAVLYFQHLGNYLADWLYKIICNSLGLEHGDARVFDNDSPLKKSLSQNGFNSYLQLEKFLTLREQIIKETGSALELYQNKSLVFCDFLHRLRLLMLIKSDRST